MAVRVSYPGVYIEEFAPGAPIQGVGTSTAAFLGVASDGELRTPTKITSWDQFRRTFGAAPAPGSYLWYAVRGFFENGGQICYVVRVSNGKYGSITIQNRAASAKNLLRVRSRQPGDPSPAITVTIADRNSLPTAPGTVLYAPTAPFTVQSSRELKMSNLTGAAAKLADAAQFRPGDRVHLGAADTNVLISQVSGDVLRLATNISLAVNATGTVRLADAPIGTRTFRIDAKQILPPGTLVPGTMLTLTQAAKSASAIVDSVQVESLATTAPKTTYRVTFRDGLSIGFNLTNAVTVASHELDITVTQGSSTPKYENLGIDPAHPRYFVDVVNQADDLVQFELIEPPPTDAPPSNLPKVGVSPALAGGAAENLAGLTTIDFEDALDTLRRIRDVNLIAIPDVNLVKTPTTGPLTIQQSLITHCQQLADRFGVLDTFPGEEPFPSSYESHRRGLDSSRGYVAFYGPWLRVPPAGSGGLVLVPPCGHVCGIMARSDNTRGVHKAPANEIVNGALGIERTMSDIEQGELNLQNINIIRIFQEGGRPVLWGARTTATDANWQYVNVRRLFLYAEQSIEAGIRWAVFEPNNLQLWQKLKRSISDFLTRIWRDGGLFGATAKDAFYVRIDEVLNPFSEQALGRLNIEIGMRPSYPAEFIVVRIGIWDGGADVTEG